MTQHIAKFPNFTLPKGTQMADLKIEVKIMNKNDSRYIMCFFADLDYSPDGFNFNRFTSSALIWIGNFADIQQRLHLTQNMDKVIVDYIAEFKKDSLMAVKELTDLAGEESVIFMVKRIESFITETIFMSYD